ncbi:MAG: tRNA preQ1(34) S-adenosylmethionine ribosyltransferase-isomerase QueA [Candidatus Krumholzibacteria bacterium]|nr:tRNA preQ1(34) S-adenosylmethionine ribosyltransferase-isomerase QueA [Candidatus Krumholzibacteria bacterium]
MRLSDFDYELPPELIAQEATADRAASRLMVCDRAAGAPVHATFRDLPQYLREGDVLVVNKSRVVPARLLLTRSTGGKVEALFLDPIDDRDFIAWVKPLGRLHPGETLKAEDGTTAFRFVERTGEREAILRLDASPHATVEAALDAIGHVPLPPYITRADRPDDRARYQTVFAQAPGSVAAPTAGLHFDPPLLQTLQSRGVEVLSLVLHVGVGTFQPLEEEEIEKNRLHAERFQIDARTIERLQTARREKRRIIAVGTTVTRTLETLAARGCLDADPQDHDAQTDLFITPGYPFQVVGALLTNFHLPQSSLLLLVCAFAGRERILAWYREAVEQRYRFYSYGDAMLIG